MNAKSVIGIVIVIVVVLFLVVFYKGSMGLDLPNGDGDEAPLDETTGTGGVSDTTDMSPEEESEMVVEKVKALALNAVKGSSDDTVRLISITAMEWPDACFGAGGVDDVCAEVVTPGYKVVFESGENQFVYHTNSSGDGVRVKEIVKITGN